MKTLAVLIVLCCATAHGAAREVKNPTRSRPAPARPVARPAKGASAAQQSEPSAKRGSAAPGPLEDLRYAVSIGAGGFFAGGANRGPAAGATLTINPAFAHRRFSLDVDLHWRMASLRAPVEGYGTLTSTLHALPLLPAIRARVLQLGALSLDLRGGLGPLLLLQNLSSDFGMGASRSSLGWEAFAAAQGLLSISAVELFLEVRAGLGEAHIPFVLGRGTGVQGSLGVRYSLP